MNGRLKHPPGFTNRIVANIRNYFGYVQQPRWIRMNRRDETEGIILLGDPGTGKSQTIHHFLLQIATRHPSESAVIYDPACEFVKRHYNLDGGDIILNPLDRRSPYWSPSHEVRSVTDKRLITESFLPGKTEFSQGSTSGFFLKAARAILGRLFEFKPAPQELVDWLGNADAIDTIVADTEHAHLIPRNAHGQRAGVLGVLSDLGDTLRLLPAKDLCKTEISLTEWAGQRKGWIFITSTVDTRDALRPLQAVFINLLMKRLMAVSPEWGQAHPCWLIVDEVHALHRLPALYEAETEGRKYGLKLIQGTQGKAQYEEYYQTLAKTMLAAPRLKLFYRCGEPESARWISDTIGEVEVEKPKIGTTASVEDKGRDSLNYATVTEQKAVVSKEEIMSLADLQGYWKYGDVVVPFRLPLAHVNLVTKGYIPRSGSIEIIEPHSTVRPTALEKRDTSMLSPSHHRFAQQRREPQTKKKSPRPQQPKFEHSMAESPKRETVVVTQPEPKQATCESSSEIGTVDTQLQEIQTDFS